MKNWHQYGSTFELRDVTTQLPTLPVGIYGLKENGLGLLELERRSDGFEFTHKVYGKDQTFIDRTVKTYHNTSNNLGILLNGVKGTGKSVTAKLLCNQLNLPVILVDSDYDDLVPFLTKIPQNVVVMLDEYEKTFGDAGKLLSVMDGIDSSSYRRVFVLTTNETYINTNMLNRPSRLRYIKHYGNLELTVVREIIEDLLIDKRFEEDLIATLRDMTHITIDLVISIIKEINIHNEPASAFSEIFNVDFKNPHFDIFQADGKTEIAKNVKIPYGRNVMATPGRWLNCTVYYEDREGNDYIIGEYKGFKDGLWYFEVEAQLMAVVFRKAAVDDFYAYA